jgi:ribosomal protein S18 acetylase RimI-like enzyme
MDDAELKARAWAGAVDFQRLVGLHAPVASLFERDGVVASVVPGVLASILNAAIAVEPRAQSADATAAVAHVYEDARIPKWGIWIDGDDTDTAETLERQGLVLDSTPVLMGAELKNIAEAEDPDSPAIVAVSLGDVGRVNDLAYGFDEPRIAPILAGFPPNEPGEQLDPSDPSGKQAFLHAYGAQIDDEIASVAIVHDVGDDAFVTFVATVRRARRRGLATSILCHALNDARQRGRHTTTLQASKAGQGIYAAIGYRPLGEQHLWERRP